MYFIKRDHLLTMIKSKNSTTLLLGGIFLILLFIGSQIYDRSSNPVSELDCLKLGSDERAAACIKLIRDNKKLSDFPLDQLEIKDLRLKRETTYNEISGTIKNLSDFEATEIMLRVDFMKDENGESFHYEVYSPFKEFSERVQPHSSKTYTTLLSNQTFNAIENLDAYYVVSVFQAKIYEP